jgi:hypothetical protein
MCSVASSEEFVISCNKKRPSVMLISSHLILLADVLQLEVKAGETNEGSIRSTRALHCKPGSTEAESGADVLILFLQKNYFPNINVTM